MQTPKVITKQLENMVGSSVIGYSNENNLEDVYDEMCEEIDKTCEIINGYFNKDNTLEEITDLLCEIEAGNISYDETYDRLYKIKQKIENLLK